MTRTTAGRLPERLRTRTTTALAVLVMLVGITLLGAVAAPARAADDPLLPLAGTCAHDTNAATDATSTEVQRMAVNCLINAVRGRAGIPALRFCAMSGSVCNFGHGITSSLITLRRAEARALNVAAQYKSQDVRDCPAGADPHLACGRAADYWPKALGYPYAVGEILTGGWPSMSPRTAVDNWLKSPGHRAIMLDARYKTVGVGLSPGVSSHGLFLPRGVFGHIYAAQLGLG